VGCVSRDYDETSVQYSGSRQKHEVERKKNQAEKPTLITQESNLVRNGRKEKLSCYLASFACTSHASGFSIFIAERESLALRYFAAEGVPVRSDVTALTVPTQLSEQVSFLRATLSWAALTTRTASRMVPRNSANPSSL